MSVVEQEEEKKETKQLYIKPGKDFTHKVNNETYYYCNSSLCQRYKHESEFYPSCRKRSIKRCKDCMMKRVKINKPSNEEDTTIIRDNEEDMIYSKILSQFRIDCHSYVKDRRDVNLVWRKLDLHTNEIKSLLNWWKEAIENDEILKQKHSINIPYDMCFVLWNECTNQSDHSIQVNLYDMVPFSKTEGRNLRKLPMSMRRQFLQDETRVNRIEDVLHSIKENIHIQQEAMLQNLVELTQTPTVTDVDS